MAPDKLTSELSLATAGNGAAPVLFARELQKALAALHDPNTDPKGVASIVVKIYIRLANEETNELRTRVQVSSKLPGYKPVEQTAYLGSDHGKLVAVAFNPVQTDAFREGADAQVTPITRKAEAAT